MGICLGVWSISSAGPAATQPVVISPQAQVLLNQIRDAYSAANSLSIHGTVRAHYDIDGVQSDHLGQFAGMYGPSGLFRNEMNETASASASATTQPSGDAIVGNTGDKLYLYLPEHNRYMMIDPPKDKITLASIGDDIGDVIRNQNYSLGLALSGDAAAELSADATAISRATDMKIDGGSYPVLLVVHPKYDVTLAIDPTTHYLRREICDLTKEAKAQGAGEVKSALLTMDYSNTPAQGVDSRQFAWTPPPGAMEIDASPGASNLEGQPAPPFALSELDGKIINNRQLRGSVYVLDFWASWCGPCCASLPRMDAIYQDVKASGVKFFAVNEEEDKEVVQKFVADSKLGIPVLLDSDGKVGAVYDTAGEIPFTVVVGKDGKVRKAGFFGGNEDQLRPIIVAAARG
jgi:thiol-disulfide isomerase/thioredoxin